MGRNTSITLGDHFARFVDSKVAEGRYNSASDVVRAGLRLLEEHENHVAAIRTALIEGEKSGEPEVLNIDEFLEDLRSEPL